MKEIIIEEDKEHIFKLIRNTDGVTIYYKYIHDGSPMEEVEKTTQELTWEDLMTDTILLRSETQINRLIDGLKKILRE